MQRVRPRVLTIARPAAAAIDQNANFSKYRVATHKQLGVEILRLRFACCVAPCL